MKIDVLDNFIQDKNVFLDIKNILLSSSFPYYYNNYVADKKDVGDYYFVHMLYNQGQQKSNYFNQVLMPILGRLNFNYLYRAKVNCYTKKPKQLKTGMHTDVPEQHMVALYSINNSNGYTLFENGDKVLSIENQLVLFNGDIKHCSVAQTDENLRVNINLNLI